MVRFDEALEEGIAIADDWAKSHDCDVVIVRDLLGRISVAIEGEPLETELIALNSAIRNRCAPFAGTEPAILLDQMFSPELITTAVDRRPAPFTISESGRVSILERGTIGAEWLSPTSEPAPRRVTLYGFKGGVGRSIATFALAQHIARTGRVVLVVDLDLESPGISSMLSPLLEDLPEHGVLDHLVEHGVGNADGLDLVSQSNAMGTLDGNGEVWFASAAGRPRNHSSYLDKLSRAYLNLPPSSMLDRPTLSFGARLEAAVAECEKQVEVRSRRPDVVLLDSPSGIHDIAAVAITQLSGLSLLFATDNPQTWEGYGELFSRWQTRLTSDMRSALRDRVQMIAALVPQTNRDDYLSQFADRSQACFARTLYDNDLDDGQDAFNFAPQDQFAPHFPIAIHHSVDLIGVVPGVDSRWNSGGAVPYAYAEFLERATQLILEEDQ